MSKLRLAIFASGKGSNAEALIRYEQANPECGYQTVLVVTNKQTAGVVDLAASMGIPCCVLDQKHSADDEHYTTALVETLVVYAIDFIALAGYLKKIPEKVVLQYQKRMVNIHPSLLPKYGGAGMYGLRVHEAVLRAGEKESGCTIHWVDAEYDAGAIICQFPVAIESEESAESLFRKIQRIEHEKYAIVLDNLARQIQQQQGYHSAHTG